jgi:hypothetical protein
LLGAVVLECTQARSIEARAEQSALQSGGKPQGGSVKVTSADGAAPAGEGTSAWLEELCRRTDAILWRSFRFALGDEDAAWPRVIFPMKGQERRVGEQESRLAFVTALLVDDDSSWAFAAEVPTRLSYRYAHRAGGPNAQRALTDLVLYRAGDDTPALAVDFQSGGRSGKSEKDESITKDIAKVLTEEPDALWFQVVRNATSASLQGLLRTLDAAISQLSNPFKLSEYLARGKTVQPRAKSITFHICVLNPDLTASIHRRLDYVPGKPKHDFFTIETSAADGALAIADGQGWRVHRWPPAVGG